MIPGPTTITWDDGFERYSVTIDGTTLTERCRDAIIGRATLTRAPAADGTQDQGLVGPFEKGRRYVNDGTTAWLDGQAYTLAWA